MSSLASSLALILVASGPLLALPQGTGSSAAQLLTTVENVPAPALAWDKQAKLLDTAIVRSEFVRLDTGALTRIAASGEQPLATFALDLFGQTHLLDIESVETVLGHRLFTGKVRGRRGEVSLAVAADGVSSGTINRARPISITIEKYRANASGLLVLGAKEVNVPLLGGILVPSVDIPVSVSGNGAKIVFDANVLSQVPQGTAVWFQTFFIDQSAVQGVAASNGTKVVIP